MNTRINTALNRIVVLHAPTEIVVGRLDFRMPSLSRCLNHVLSTCGRAVFWAKLADLRDRSGIATAEINRACPAWKCGFT